MKQMKEEQDLLESLKKYELKNQKNDELKRKAIEEMKKKAEDKNKKWQDKRTEHLNKEFIINPGEHATINFASLKQKNKRDSDSASPAAAKNMLVLDR